MDFNLSARVDYEDQFIEKAHKAYPSHQTSFSLNIREDQAFLIKKIKWTPILPVVHIKDRESACGEIQFFPPIKMLTTDRIGITTPVGLERSDRAPDPHIAMRFQIWGTLFTYKPNVQISDKELIGISLMDHNSRGLSHLEEEAVNGLNDYIISMGGPDLRALPMSLASIQALPEVFQHAICSLLFDPKARDKALMMNRAKALPVDAVKQFAADAAKGTPVEKLDIDYLRELARHMIILGWKKD
jgi:hypothetical protein